MLAQERLIAIGLTSGLGSIAYSVLDVSSAESELLWWEVMPGPRERRKVSHYRRYKAHRLMLSMIFDRWPPTVIALGPPSTDDEPTEWVVFMRAAVFELGRYLNVRVVLFDTDEKIAAELGAADRGRGNGLKSLVRKRLTDFNSNKPRVILATATAMAGAIQLENSLSNIGKSS